MASEERIDEVLRLIENIHRVRRPDVRQQKGRDYRNCLKEMSEDYSKSEGRRICDFSSQIIREIEGEVEKRAQKLMAQVESGCYDYIKNRQKKQEPATEPAVADESTKLGTQACTALAIGKLAQEINEFNIQSSIPLLEASCDDGNLMGCDLLNRIMHEQTIPRTDSEKQQALQKMIDKVEQSTQNCIQGDGWSCNEVGSFFMQTLEDLVGPNGRIMDHEDDSIETYAAKALFFFQRACVLKEGAGCYGAGVANFNFNQKSYLKWFVQGCNLGHPTSCSKASRFYAENERIEESLQLASKACTLRDCANDPPYDIYSTMATQSLSKGDKNSTIHFLKESCMNCLDKENCLHLSRLYYDKKFISSMEQKMKKSFGFEENHTLAKKYLKIGCGLGQLRACELLHHFPEIPSFVLKKLNKPSN